MKIVEIQGNIFVKRWWNLYYLTVMDGTWVLIKARHRRGR